jgi:phosphopantetheinyl transferase
LIELPFEITLDSYLELSNYIVKNLGLDPKLKSILYNKKGQPFIYNLDLLYTRLPKLDFSETFYVIFTASPSTVDEAIA